MAGQKEVSSRITELVGDESPDESKTELMNPSLACTRERYKLIFARPGSKVFVDGFTLVN
jgi:hypothetical protein